MAADDEVERLFKLLLKAIQGDAQTMMTVRLQPHQAITQDLGTCRVQIQGLHGMESYGIAVVAYKL